MSPEAGDVVGEVAPRPVGVALGTLSALIIYATLGLGTTPRASVVCVVPDLRAELAAVGTTVYSSAINVEVFPRLVPAAFSALTA
jgi:hypothetical protein